MIKRLISLVVIALFFAASTVSGEEYSVTAKHAIAVDLESGKVLYEKDAKEVVPVASVSKLLTTYLVYKEVSKGKLNWDSPVTISNYPYELTTNYTISNVPLDKRKY
ncbi:TPA: serine hydrolase, partial [Streptococcus pyogenes]